MNSRVARFALALLVLAAAIPAVARVTEDDIARARRDLDRVMADADELGARVQAAWARQLELEHEISKLEQPIAVGRGLGLGHREAQTKREDPQGSSLSRQQSDLTSG